MNPSAMEYCRIYFNLLTEEEQPDAVIALNTQRGQTVRSVEDCSEDEMAQIIADYKMNGWNYVNFSCIEGHHVYTFRRASAAL